MRRWILFAAILASALTIYIEFTLSFSQRTENPFAGAQPLKIIETVNAQSNSNRPVETAVIEQNSDKQKFHCKDRETLEVWMVLKKTKYLIDQLQGASETGDCKDYLEIIKRIDLNDDGKDELYVEGGYKISPVSFRPSWIFQKTGDGYRQILEERDDNYKILNTKTNGFHDLYFVSRRTTYTQFLSTYKYKNGEYESVKCLVTVPFRDDQKAKLFNCNNEKGIEEFEKKNGQINNQP